jgi:hypothetical protein
MKKIKITSATFQKNSSTGEGKLLKKGFSTVSSVSQTKSALKWT